MSVSKLTLGWKVSRKFDPKYWLTSNAKAGSQSDHDLVTIQSSSIAAHTAIIAQSGSGKSFFLGRLIEEISTKTKCRCVIIDPNADFRNINKVENETLWTDAKYDQDTRRGKLPHEKDRETFFKQWSEISIQINGAFGKNVTSPRKNLKLWWPSVSIELITEDVDPILKNEIYHCHRLVKAFAQLKELTESKSQDNFVDEAQEFLRLTRTNNFNLQGNLEKQFGEIDSGKNSYLISLFNLFLKPKLLKEQLFREIINASEYISVAAERYYFGKVKEFDAAGILRDNIANGKQEKEELTRLTVLDLPSLEKNIQFLAISSFLKIEQDRAQAEWNNAIETNSTDDKRVPTFIIVDEAHNLMPATVTSKAQEVLKEKFKTIVAEGRKYGLFLILVSQRPDKLDSLIVSECENKAIMKLSTISVLKTAIKMLGLEYIPQSTLEKCLDFPSGRVLLIGQWTDNHPRLLYSATRRTIEGGRDLRKDYWASEPIKTATTLLSPSNNKDQKVSESKEKDENINKATASIKKQAEQRKASPKKEKNLIL